MSFSDTVGFMFLQKSSTSKAWVRSYVCEVCQTLIVIYSFNNYLFRSYNVQYGFTWLLTFQRVTDLIFGEESMPPLLLP